MESHAQDEALFFGASPCLNTLLDLLGEEGESYARLLIPMLVVRFTVLPTCWSLFAFNKQHVVMYWNLAHLAQAIAALALGGWQRDASLAVFCYSLTSSVMYMVLFFL